MSDLFHDALISGGFFVLGLAMLLVELCSISDNEWQRRHRRVGIIGSMIIMAVALIPVGVHFWKWLFG